MTTILLLTGITFSVSVLLILCLQDYRFRRSPLVKAKGTVFGHKRSTDMDGASYFMQLRFVAGDGRNVEVTDTVGRPEPFPPSGTVVDVVYPAGSPDKAIVSRPLLRVLLYAFVLSLLAILAARMAGWLQ